jgi:hypothetical protein
MIRRRFYEKNTIRSRMSQERGIRARDGKVI